MGSWAPDSFEFIKVLRVGVSEATKEKHATYVNIRCGHVVRDFESEAKTRCNFQFR